MYTCILYVTTFGSQVLCLDKLNRSIIIIPSRADAVGPRRRLGLRGQSHAHFDTRASCVLTIFRTIVLTRGKLAGTDISCAITITTVGIKRALWNILWRCVRRKGAKIQHVVRGMFGRDVMDKVMVERRVNLETVVVTTVDVVVADEIKDVVGRVDIDTGVDMISHNPLQVVSRTATLAPNIMKRAVNVSSLDTNVVTVDRRMVVVVVVVVVVAVVDVAVVDVAVDVVGAPFRKPSGGDREYC